MWRDFAPITADVERDGILQTVFTTGRINDLNNIFVDFLFCFNANGTGNEWNSIESTTRQDKWIASESSAVRKIYFHTVKICQTLVWDTVCRVQ